MNSCSKGSTPVTQFPLRQSGGLSGTLRLQHLLLVAVPKVLVISPRAQTDVDEEAAHYQATDSLATATRFLDDLRHVFERLVEFPQRRRLLPHFPYSVFYLPSEQRERGKGEIRFLPSLATF